MPGVPVLPGDNSLAWVGAPAPGWGGRPGWSSWTDQESAIAVGGYQNAFGDRLVAVTRVEGGWSRKS